MTTMRTGLKRNLHILYHQHGGVGALVRSGYFWLSASVAFLCWPSVVSLSWIKLAEGALPTLAGFSIAAFAILFAVLDAPSRQALAAPDPDLDGRSPLLMVVSAISHGVIVQITALLYSFVFEQHPLPSLLTAYQTGLVNDAFSAAGLFLLVYSIVLVIASILTVFSLLEIRSRV